MYVCTLEPERNVLKPVLPYSTHWLHPCLQAAVTYHNVTYSQLLFSGIA